MNSLNLYRYYCNNESFDVDLFRKSTSIFFDAHLDLKSHDRFFNNFTINLSRGTIHKGSAYYFWAVTCILKEDLEKGFLLMHQALEEDMRNRSNELMQ
jgi:hypothetical protein